MAKLTDALQLGWDYYATDKTVMVKDYPRHGLALRPEVLTKLFGTNTQGWFLVFSSVNRP